MKNYLLKKKGEIAEKSGYFKLDLPWGDYDYWLCANNLSHFQIRENGILVFFKDESCLSFFLFLKDQSLEIIDTLINCLKEATSDENIKSIELLSKLKMND